MKRAIAVLSLLSAVACGGQGFTVTQPDPVSENQIFMIGEMQRFEPMLNMGQFFVTFEKPPAETYAGWADCRQSGAKPPWLIHFNKEYIETLSSDRRHYMTALVAHEMCHHWVSQHGGSCWDEKGAEACAANLQSKGAPK